MCDKEITATNEKLESLKLKYSGVLQVWINRHSASHPMWEFIVNANKVLHHEFKSSLKLLLGLEHQLERLFPIKKLDPVIVLDDDDDDRNNVIEISDSEEFVENTVQNSPPRCIQTRPSTPRLIRSQKKLTEKKLDNNNNKPTASLSSTLTSLTSNSPKTPPKARLPPSAAYARPTDKNKETRNILTVPYKNQPKPKANFDPRENTIKLANIKEKIYAKNYLDFDTKQDLIRKAEEKKRSEIEEKQRREAQERKQNLTNLLKNKRNNKDRDHDEFKTSISEKNCQTFKKLLRYRSKSLSLQKSPMCEKEISEEDSSEDTIFDEIQIQKTKRPIKRGRNKLIVVEITPETTNSNTIDQSDTKSPIEPKPITLDDDAEGLLVALPYTPEKYKYRASKKSQIRKRCQTLFN